MLSFAIALALSAAQAPATTPPAPPANPAIARAATYEQLYRDTGNAALLWLIAMAHAEGGQDAEAIAALERVAGRKLGFVVTPDSPLSRLTGKPKFDQLAAQLQREYQIVRKGHVVATIAWPGLVPEGIASDPRTKRLFVGDMAGKTVLTLKPGGKARRFASTGRLRPLGMKVDRDRGLLWVAATGAFIKSDKPENALLGFDLATGALKQSHSSPEMKSVNDLAVAPNGDIYMTDSLGGALFRLKRGTAKIERIAPDARMSYANGVAVSGDGKSVYVAQGVAFRRIDAASGAVTTVTQPADVALLSIDGLYWHKGSLSGVQNNGNPGRVLRWRLSADGSAITGHDVLEAGNPDFDIPTTATVLGNRLILIANSQLTRLGDDGAITKGPPLKPIKLMEIAIPR